MYGVAAVLDPFELCLIHCVDLYGSKKSPIEYSAPDSRCSGCACLLAYLGRLALSAECEFPHRESETLPTFLLMMLMEDVMTHTDANSLYVLICSLCATAISLPAVWYFTAAAYASSGLAA